METKFRTAPGNDLFSPGQVIAYEIAVLGNDHIVDDMLEHGIFDEAFAVGIRSKNIFESDVVEMAAAIDDKISAAFGRELPYCLWLADFDEVCGHYADDGEDIFEYEPSPFVLVHDIEGNLYGYEKKPDPVNIVTLENSDTGEPPLPKGRGFFYTDAAQTPV